MADARPRVTLADIQVAVQEIVQRVHPRKAILFGSYAYGEPHEESDVDLLVVVAGPPSVHEAWEVARQIRQRTGVPVQVWFMSPEEFEETKDVVGGLAFPAHHWGQVVHEAHP